MWCQWVLVACRTKDILLNRSVKENKIYFALCFLQTSALQCMLVYGTLDQLELHVKNTFVLVKGKFRVQSKANTSSPLFSLLSEVTRSFMFLCDLTLH